jgi:hypothetical protein
MIPKQFPFMPKNFKPDEVLVGASYKDQDLGFIVQVKEDGTIDYDHFAKAFEQLKQGLWDAAIGTKGGEQ